MAEHLNAVFLSYASQDAEAASRICNALRAAGVEVWFDRSELRGGDVWDQQINAQIRQCRLFIAVISAHTEARDEGYFRREWGIALDRMRDMAEHRTFLVPVVIDDTAERSAAVPERFRQIQWSRLTSAAALQAFTVRIAGLLGAPPPAAATDTSASAPPYPPRPARGRRDTGMLLGFVALATLIAGLGWRYAYVSSPVAPRKTSGSPATLADKSVVVLPFADLSEHHDEEYFADGMAEELIDRLGQISELRVISRTSAFQFKGKSEDVREIGARLSVANILEGSVRRAQDQLRIEVKLVSAADGAQRWSQRYDRGIGDVFKVQDEIANETALALKARLVEGNSPEQAATHSADAHNLLLEGRFLGERWAPGDSEHAINLYRQALADDPNYVPAWAELSWAQMWASPQNYEGCASAARRAVELGPNLAQAHATRGWCESLLGYDWALGKAEFDRALALEPNNTRALYGRGRLARVLGNLDESLRYYQAVLTRDPVNPFVMTGLSTSLIAAGRTAEAVKTARAALALSPNMQQAHFYVAWTLLWNNEPEAALREAALEPIASAHSWCTALIEQARGNRPAADRALHTLLTTKDQFQPYLVAEVYAARGDAKAAIEWLERVRSSRSGWFGEVAGDPAFKPVRTDPQFVAFLRRSKLLE